MSEGAIVQGEGVEVLPLQVGEGADQSAVVAAPAEVWLKLEDIVVKPDEVQIRIKHVFEHRIEAMTAAMENGQDLGAITVYEVKGILWLADGFHRMEVHRRKGLRKIKAIIHVGNADDLLLGAGSGNLAHGLELSSDDKYKLYAMLWKMNPTLAQMEKNGYHIPLDGQLHWQSISGRVRAGVLGLSSSTENNWAIRVREGERITKVMAADGREIDVRRQADNGASRSLNLRQDKKKAWLLQVGDINRWEFENLQFYEFSDDPKDHRMYLIHPTKGKILVGGPKKRPVDEFMDAQKAVALAEKKVNNHPPSDIGEVRTVPNGEADWKPAGAPVVVTPVGQEQPTVWTPLGIDVLHTTDSRVSRMLKAIAFLESAMSEFDEAFAEVKTVRSIRTINEMGGEWREGTRGMLANLLKSVDSLHVHKERIIDLLGQLDYPADTEGESPESVLMDVCCATCGKDFKAEPYHGHEVNKNPNYYCSQECVRAGMNKAYEASKERRPVKLESDGGGE